MANSNQNQADSRKRDIEEKELLSLMYKVQEKMEKLLDKGTEDKHYFLMEILIKRLEDYLIESNRELL